MLEIRVANEADRFFLAQVCRSVAPLYDLILPGAFEKQAVRFIEQGLPKEYQIMLIYTDSRPVGFIGVTEVTSQMLYLVALYLLVEEQGKGFGKEVLNLIKQSSLEQGYHEIVLLAHQNAHWAINFYLQNGFEVIGNTEKVIREYQGSVLANYYLPATVLLRKRPLW